MPDATCRVKSEESNYGRTSPCMDQFYNRHHLKNGAIIIAYKELHCKPIVYNIHCRAFCIDFSRKRFSQLHLNFKQWSESMEILWRTFLLILICHPRMYTQQEALLEIFAKETSSSCAFLCPVLIKSSRYRNGRDLVRRVSHITANQDCRSHSVASPPKRIFVR